MLRPEPVLEPCGGRTAHREHGCKARRIHFHHSRSKNQIALRRREFSGIRIERPGIGGEIFRWRELGWIDEDRKNDLSSVSFRFFDKRNMSGMKRAHCRHEANRLARAPPGCEPRS